MSQNQKQRLLVNVFDEFMWIHFETIGGIGDQKKLSQLRLMEFSEPQNLLGWVVVFIPETKGYSVLAINCVVDFKTSRKYCFGFGDDVDSII